jgi:GNAT superfamily N-acetyltransferase
MAAQQRSSAIKQTELLMSTPPDFTLRLATEDDIPALHALIEASVRGLMTGVPSDRSSSQGWKTGVPSDRSSSQGWKTGDYTQPQIEGALGTVLGLDTQLIKDRTYYVAEPTGFVADSGRVEHAPEEKEINGEPISESFVPGRDLSRADKDPNIACALAPAKANPASDPKQAPQSRTHPTLAGCGGWSKRKTLFGADRGPGREPDLLDPTTDAAKVRAIFVHPAFARQGLGSLILATVEKAAYDAGFRKYEMGSTLTGYPLYRLKGYIEVERIEVPLHNGESVQVVKMTKNTPP